LDKYKNINITIASQGSPPLLGRVGWGEYIWAVVCCFERLKDKGKKRMIVFPSSQPSPFGEGAYVVYCEFCLFWISTKT